MGVALAVDFWWGVERDATWRTDGVCESGWWRECSARRG
jgi:hypothetical protein